MDRDIDRTAGLVIHAQRRDIEVLIQQHHGAAMEGSRVHRLHHPAAGVIDRHAIPQVGPKVANLLEGFVGMTENEGNLTGKILLSIGAFMNNLYLKRPVDVILQSLHGVLAQMLIGLAGLGAFGIDQLILQGIDDRLACLIVKPVT